MPGGCCISCRWRCRPKTSRRCRWPRRKNPGRSCMASMPPRIRCLTPPWSNCCSRAWTVIRLHRRWCSAIRRWTMPRWRRAASPWPRSCVRWAWGRPPSSWWRCRVRWNWWWRCWRYCAQVALTCHWTLPIRLSAWRASWHRRSRSAYWQRPAHNPGWQTYRCCRRSSGPM
ncbi:hypothetical protein D3C72_1252540 [compost metagenome]